MVSQNKNKGKKVFVGLSGGVDSAVSAAILKKEGYEVTGVFIKAWTPPGYICTWREDRRSAMRAAAVLDIPFITLDLEKEYKKQVVDYMIREYKGGRTPNPDVMCNKEIKFGAFLKFALENGADFVATGHYAQTSPRPRKLGLPLSLSRRGERGEVELKEGKDKNKDQSYFLWTLTQKQLKHILFPVGGFQKEEVRRLARKFGLPQATRKDSQGLCFLGQIDMKEFLKENIKTKKGKVLNQKGEVVGEHDGAILYTIGERHGFEVKNQTRENSPLYVVSKDIKNNTITVAPQKSISQKVLGSLRSTRLSSKHFFLELEDINWISGIPKGKIYCRLRYRQEKIPCKIQSQKVIFEIPQTVAPGQSVVFYQDEICLGGGIMT